MPYPGEVLVAILNNSLDFALARERGWYRVPVNSQYHWLRDKWPPKYLAFYMTKVFGEMAYGIHFYAQVKSIQQVNRSKLFPDEPTNPKSERQYFQLMLGKIQTLPNPIVSRCRRRIIFIPTTREKFIRAREINDLYLGSSLEEALWTELNVNRIPAEREYHVTVKNKNYFLDFAIFCTQGNLCLETDGDEWHANPEKAAQDNIRDSYLTTAGWKTFHFTTLQIQEELGSYCLPLVLENINKLGGLDEGSLIPRKIDPKAPPDTYQLTLFDDGDAQE